MIYRVAPRSATSNSVLGVLGASEHAQAHEVLNERLHAIQEVRRVPAGAEVLTAELLTFTVRASFRKLGNRLLGAIDMANVSSLVEILTKKQVAESVFNYASDVERGDVTQVVGFLGQLLDKIIRALGGHPLGGEHHTRAVLNSDVALELLELLRCEHGGQAVHEVGANVHFVLLC